ncbi:MAG TPA: pro-sigmaK processing inhibitor BofA family protein [Clostridia bacterium]|nr:pro-sigmaK processing inhibitor BofA family protein [Clostridia bacterium]
MGLDINFGMVYAFAIGLGLLYLVGKLITVPIKLVIKLLANGIIGGLLLMLINFFGTYIGLSIEVNPINAVVAGFLGIPGVILLLILNLR